MMDASQCDSKRSGWQGLTARRRTALGASATISTAAMVAVTTALLALVAAVAPLFSTIAALVALLLAAGLTARLALTRAALIALEMASAPAAATAAAIWALLRVFAVGAGRAWGLRFRRGGGRTAKELLHPGEEAARFCRRLALGRRSRFRPGQLIARRPSGSSPSRTRVGAGLSWLVIPAFPLGAKDGPVIATIVTRRAGGRGIGGPSLLTRWLARNIAEGFAFPVVFDAFGRLGREDLQLRLRLRLDRSGANRLFIGNPDWLAGDRSDRRRSCDNRGDGKRSRC